MSGLSPCTSSHAYPRRSLFCFTSACGSETAPRPGGKNQCQFRLPFFPPRRSRRKPCDGVACHPSGAGISLEMSRRTWRMPLTGKATAIEISATMIVSEM